jgi:hypothetical protein
MFWWILIPIGFIVIFVGTLFLLFMKGSKVPSTRPPKLPKEYTHDCST